MSLTKLNVLHTMSNRSSDILFQLIRSLEKAEKRHFKLYIKRSSSNENLKIIKLFDALDKMKEYDESLLKKDPNFSKQLSNLKAHLYKQLLSSLRLLKSTDSLDIQLNEQYDFAHILYKKGLFNQSLRIIEKAKEVARAYQKYGFLPQLITLEKKIESLHITRSIQNKADLLSEEAIVVSTHIDMVARLSNLALQLYGWYIRNGHARNEDDEQGVKQFLKENLPPNAWEQKGFYEQLYLYQSYSWYGFIRQNFLQYYKYSQKWVNLYHDDPLMKRVETGHYIKGLHNLLNAHFDLRNDPRFDETLREFEAFAATERVQDNENFRIQAFVYLSQAKINRHFMRGTFKEGLALIPDLLQKLEEYSLFIDRHRVLVFNYKIAVLYFGSGDYSKCIDYIQNIIHDQTDLRYDLQCYARVVHLMAHYELGNYDIMDYLTRSVYRFMAKMQNLTVIEEEMFKFLRQSFSISRFELKRQFEAFLAQVKEHEGSRFETRSFAYLDVISWIESKVNNKSMAEIIGDKYRERLARRNKSLITVGSPVLKLKAS